MKSAEEAFVLHNWYKSSGQLFLSPASLF